LGRHERADGHGWRWVWDDGHGWWRAAAAEQVGSTRYSVYYSVYLLYWYKRWGWMSEGSGASSRASRAYLEKYTY
jgi:hypothetical protein